MNDRSKNYVTQSTATDSKNRHAEDFYPTPERATRALLAVERFSRRIWEPACGDGALSRVLEAAGHEVASSDLYDRGYGTSGIDFLTQDGARYDNVVTNPPFKFAEEFTHQALRVARRKVAMLFRLAWLEGQRRYTRLYTVTPPTRVLVFSQRVHMSRGGTRKIDGSGGMIAFCWMVWDKSDVSGRTELKWLKPEKD